jgi:hypothetical protein
MNKIRQKQIEREMQQKNLKLYNPISSSRTNSGTKFHFLAKEGFEKQDYCKNIAKIVAKTKEKLAPKFGEVNIQDVINFMVIAIKNGGIGNITSPQDAANDALSQEIAKLYQSEERVQKRKLAINFSGVFQEICKNEKGEFANMFSGNLLAKELQGLRLKRIDPNAIK